MSKVWPPLRLLRGTVRGNVNLFLMCIDTTSFHSISCPFRLLIIDTWVSQKHKRENRHFVLSLYQRHKHGRHVWQRYQHVIVNLNLLFNGRERNNMAAQRSSNSKQNQYLFRVNSVTLRHQQHTYTGQTKQFQSL